MGLTGVLAWNPDCPVWSIPAWTANAAPNRLAHPATLKPMTIVLL